ncbi:hypothetical protein L1987_00059 [Smallanthus sonchifolius]|uniref:Uncharacterized protein n=1 Tax=Smallanthus sonchifolius TaxID=185202 RepID=A0ACB9K159_9ASTR|nr:hypothetical protein L1987_00059 [Smallanthus sonchifolius]
MTATDRPGLFSDISAALADLHCNIVEAHAWSHNARLACVAYISDQSSNTRIDGHRAGDSESTMTTVERRLHQLLLSAQDFDVPPVQQRAYAPGISGGMNSDGEKEAEKANVLIENCSEKGYSIVTVQCRDRRRLMFDTVCTLADIQYVISHASVDSHGGYAFQEYFIRKIDGGALCLDSETQHAMKCLEAAVERRVCEGTRLELCANNRVGLLSDITRVLREKGLVVLRADLATKMDKCVDITFYVKDIVGNNVDMELVKSMKREMGLIDLAVKNKKVVKSQPTMKPRFSIGDIFKSQIERLSHIVLSKMVDTRKSTNRSSQCKDETRLNDDRYLGKQPTKNHIKVQKETSSRIKKVETSSTRYFISILKPYSFKSSRLYVPAEFSIANDLRIGEMILRDDKGRSWKVQLNKIGKNRFSLGYGYREFWVANGLMEGDVCKFELVENEKNKPYIVNFSLNVDSTPSRQEAHISLKETGLTRKENSSSRYFLSTLKPYSLKRSLLYLPVAFFISNDLRMGEVILRDDKGRLWRVKLRKTSKSRNRLYLGCGFRDFLVANGLREGDAYKFELVENEKDKPPIVNFSYLGKKDVKNHIQIKETSSTIKVKDSTLVENAKLNVDSTPSRQENHIALKETSLTRKDTSSSRYFISTMKPYSFKKSCLYLPADFLISNDLRMGEVILRDDKGRLWRVKIKKKGKTQNRLYLGCGFRDFWVANGLTEGDAYKFELVENEKDKPPIVNFSYLGKKAVKNHIQLEETGSTIKKVADSTRVEKEKVKVDSTPSGTEDYPYYIGKLKSYVLEQSILYLPNEFARKNGLFNKEEMNLKNVDERSWTVEIKCNMNRYCYIRGLGWKDFCVAIGLKEGDLFKFELVSNGEIPVANFFLR